MSNKQTQPTDNEMRKAIGLALGLGGWDRDDADPFKAPYSPRSSALAAAKRFEITDAQAIAFIESTVRLARDEDAEQRARREQLDRLRRRNDELEQELDELRDES